MKYEVAEELGLRDDIERRGWGEMTTREVGTIGGHMVRKMIRFAERHLSGQDGGDGQAEPQG
jgi:small acid-soluble spore protein F (minor alpha/beta-type SASP)